MLVKTALGVLGRVLIQRVLTSTTCRLSKSKILEFTVQQVVLHLLIY